MVVQVDGSRTISQLSRRGPQERSRIKVEELQPSDEDSLKALYKVYEECFPIVDEREPPEAFQELFALNQDLAAQEKYGPYREFACLIRLWDGGPVVGGHIFGVTTSAAHIEAGFPCSIHAIYTFLHKDYRGLIFPRTLLDYSKVVALSVFPPVGKHLGEPVIFFEVNSPEKMTPQEISQDKEISGVDPYRRYQFWLRLGFRPLDFAYTQPRLRPDAAPVKCLDLFCSKSVGISIPTGVLLAHLRAFVSISVLKNFAAENDHDFNEMKKSIIKFRSIPLKEKS